MHKRINARFALAGAAPSFWLLLAGCGPVEDQKTGETVASTENEGSVPDEGITPQLRNSEMWRRHVAFQSNPEALKKAGTTSDTVAEYAAKCDIATGIHVPEFNCDNGTLVLGQDPTAPDKCDQPNVLHGTCDPGSRFQVLVQTTDAAAVAHCRKVGLAVTDPHYQDIAVIQYNKKNGALCFYQELGTLPAGVVAPAMNPPAGLWISPAGTEALKCTGCHDNGGFVRSGYIRQVAIPSTAAGFTNSTSPVGYVGADYALNLSWSVSASGSTVTTDCTGCHRIAVNNADLNGTAMKFARTATAPSLPHKSPHSATSPIWMIPPATGFNQGNYDSALAYQQCAEAVWAGKSQYFDTPSMSLSVPGVTCGFAPLGAPWNGLAPAEAVAVVTAALR